MKVKLLIKVLPNGQGRSDREKEVTKVVDIDDRAEEIMLSNILSQLDEKTRKDLDNRMVSYLNNTFKAFVMIGNFWLEKPNNFHKDISEAKN